MASELKHAGVVGDPINHSMSPILHNAGGEYASFERYRVQKGQLRSFLENLDTSWAGLAVTMPLKQEALAVCDVVDGLAKGVGSVNTLVIQPTGSSSLCVGFNTDVAGIVRAVRECAAERGVFSKVLILGSGATASSALAAAIELGAQRVRVCARRQAGSGVFMAAHRLNIDLETGSIAQAAQEIQQADLVISTLPAHVADPIADELTQCAAVINAAVLDVAYDPYPSRLSSAVEKLGGTVVPGWLMLLHQAIDQIRLFNGDLAKEEAMREALAEQLRWRAIG
ncbi:shikimate dehydrogenase [Arcanobacterium pluranimalium]|uniref:shikimate dehydrogenase family protein n=1 Tax=Arcanobacterium pluranimalium TaxID=108028 RepID=UPI001956E775|nr:shikimate dehydrogenase [Arcanobacterium pluranimalium]MBM7825443.1 shikimate dehydrogenase [Arcanobacterium pluranimalium]